MFDATPDFPTQLRDLALADPARPVLDGIFLTHAHVGHYAGLMYLGHEVMGSRDVPIYAMPRMRAFLEANGPWSQLVSYHNIAIRTLAAGANVDLGNGLTVTPIFVLHRQEFSEVVGYRIAGSEKRVLFIPDIDSWEQWDALGVRLETELAQVDVAYLDATFYGPAELPGRNMALVPHPPITHTMDRLAPLPAAERTKVRFIHLNRTNPVLAPGSPAQSEVRARAFNLAAEGEKIGIWPRRGLSEPDRPVTAAARIGDSVPDRPAPPCGDALAPHRNRGTPRMTAKNQTIAPLAAAVLLAFAGTATRANLITNGDFQTGALGPATTTYALDNTMYPEGTWHVVSYDTIHPSWVDYYDHTKGDSQGYLMVVNGQTSSHGYAWREDVTSGVTANTNYDLSGWFSSLYPQSIANLSFRIVDLSTNNYIATSNFTAPSQTAVWQQDTLTFNSGSATQLGIEVWDTNLIASGNDYAIDDLKLVTSASSAVPEPTTLAMFSPAALALLARRRRHCRMPA